MPPKTKHQIFKEWLVGATIDELEEELFGLDETNLSLLSQLAQHELRFKTEIPTQENEEWRGRANHLQRWTYYQKKAIERRIVAISQKLSAEIKAENVRLNIEAAKLKFERLAANPEIELRRAEHNRIVEEAVRVKAEHNRLIEEAIRLKHERVTNHDQMWIQAAKMVLDTATFGQITNVANELISATDRESAQ